MDPFRQKLCIWAGPVSLACFLIGMSFTGFALPMSSELRPEEVVAFYQQHRVGIRIAAIFSLFCSGFMMMFAAAISAQLQRIEGRTTPWVFVQLMGGVMGNIPFALTGIIWTVAVFRPDRACTLGLPKKRPRLDRPKEQRSAADGSHQHQPRSPHREPHPRS